MNLLGRADNVKVEFSCRSGVRDVFQPCTRVQRFSLGLKQIVKTLPKPIFFLPLPSFFSSYQPSIFLSSSPLFLSLTRLLYCIKTRYHDTTSVLSSRWHHARKRPKKHLLMKVRDSRPSCARVKLTSPPLYST